MKHYNKIMQPAEETNKLGCRATNKLHYDSEIFFFFFLFVFLKEQEIFYFLLSKRTILKYSIRLKKSRKDKIWTKGDGEDFNPSVCEHFVWAFSLEKIYQFEEWSVFSPPRCRQWSNFFITASMIKLILLFINNLISQTNSTTNLIKFL